MDFKISKYIAELLTNYGQVKVAGLGTFVTNDDEHNLEDKPRQSPQLNQDLDQDILLKHIMTTTNSNVSIAKKFIEEQVNLIKKEVNNGELVYLQKIGHLYKNHQGNSIFLPEKSEANQAKFLRPDLELQPITSEEIQEVKKLIKKPSKSKSPLSKSLSTIAPIAVLLLACALTWSLISGKGKTDKGNFSVPVAEKRVNESPEYEYTPPVVKDKKKDLDGVFESNIDTESATANPDGKECVIIVGQFRSKDGARRRLAEIFEFGYAAYEDHANGLHRVGIQFPYESRSDIDQKMREVKKKFDLDAWVLKD